MGARADKLTKFRVEGQNGVHLPGVRNNEAIGVYAVAGTGKEHERRLAKSLRQHVLEALAQPRTNYVELDKQNTVGSEMAAGLAQGLHGVHKIINAHVGIIGKLSVRIQQRKQDKIVMAGGALEESAGITQVHRNQRRIVGMFGMIAAS